MERLPAEDYNNVNLASAGSMLERHGQTSASLESREGPAFVLCRNSRKAALMLLFTASHPL
jgi:hypothetical protein